ncbi:cellulose binding domain-containing protein [Microbispora sp. NPDC049125]|uniref:cellulose binding domain-containing protein n=1 Tax=Microbispora sp. NPDC049125 TaxID=3154929 RepID=UPI00346648E8
MRRSLVAFWAAAAALVAAAFLIPAAGSAWAAGTAGTTAAPPPSSPSPSLLWPCYDPLTYPPSRPPLTPPTAPGTPQKVMVANNYVELRWGASTDAEGIACYQVFEERNGTSYKVGTFGPTVTQGTVVVEYPPYGTASRVATLYVVAVDRWGAVSPRSDTLSVTINNDVVFSPSWTPSPTPAIACRVSYASYTWFGGMTSNLTISNTGRTIIAGWRLTFSFPDAGQHVTNGWEADWAQTGSSVTATGLSNRRDLAPGESVTVGFNGSHTGANPWPTPFRVNGVTCS